MEEEERLMPLVKRVAKKVNCNENVQYDDKNTEKITPPMIDKVRVS